MHTLESALYPIVSSLDSGIGNLLVFLLIAIGLWYSIQTRFVQVRCFGEGMRRTFGTRGAGFSRVTSTHSLLPVRVA